MTKRLEAKLRLGASRQKHTLIFKSFFLVYSLYSQVISRHSYDNLHGSPKLSNISTSFVVFESSTVPSGAVRSSVLSPLKTPISPLVFHCRESGAVTTMLRAPTFNVMVRATPGVAEKGKPIKALLQIN